MNAGSTVFKGVAAALVLIAGGVGCSHNGGSDRVSRSERREREKSERRISEQNKMYATHSSSRTSYNSGNDGRTTVADAPPLTYSSQTAYAQPVTYSTNVPVGMAPHQDAVVTVTSDGPTPVTPATYSQTYSPQTEYVQDTAYPTNASIAAGERQRSEATVTAPNAPPARRMETPTHTPSADEFWINGHWRWESNAFTWQPGRMERRRPKESRINKSYNYSCGEML